MTCVVHGDVAEEGRVVAKIDGAGTEERLVMKRKVLKVSQRTSLWICTRLLWARLPGQ